MKATMAAAASDDVSAFFGSKGGLRPQMWFLNDLSMGQAIFHHHQCQTLPLIHQTASSDHGDDGPLPRMIHIVWLGDQPLSKQSEECIESWHRHHPGWVFQVWRDDDIVKQHDQLFNKDALKYALRHGHYGMASDILRLELLYQHGGLYVDVDYFCVASLTDLHDGRFDFYCGASNTGCVEINNGIFACQPGHFLLKRLMRAIQTWFQEHNARCQAFEAMGAFLDEQTRTSLASAQTLSHQNVIRLTGPGLWTITLAQALVDDEATQRVAILPSTFFHPMPNTQRARPESLEQWVVPNQTRAIHLWQRSWQHES
jgi:hypothetical protein